MSEIAPGWYRDPADPQTQRYWDGAGWVGAPLPADATPPDGPPPPEPEPTPPPAPAADEAPARAREQAPPTRPNPTVAVGTDAPTGDPAAPPGPGAAPPAGPAVPPGTPGGPAGRPYPPHLGAAPLLPLPHGRPLATPGARFVARVIDIIAVFLLCAAVTSWFVWQWWLEVSPVLRRIVEDPTGDPPQVSSRGEYLLITILILITALWMAYEVPAVGNTGQTFGKRVMGIKVVPVEKDAPLGFGRAFRRWFRVGMWTPFWSCYGIGLLFQAIDSLSLLFDRPLRQALHDKGAGTVVIQLPTTAARPTPADSTPPADRTDPPGGPR